MLEETPQAQLQDSNPGVGAAFEGRVSTAQRGRLVCTIAMSSGALRKLPDNPCAGMRAPGDSELPGTVAP